MNIYVFYISQLLLAMLETNTKERSSSFQFMDQAVIAIPFASVVTAS